MIKYQPYTYLIGWSKHDKWYYGCEHANNKQKTANPKNLWSTYFTSSEHVKKFREDFGEPDVIKIRLLGSRKTVLKCESRILLKQQAAQSDKWINKQNGNLNFHSNKEVGKKISESLKGKPKSEEQRRAMCVPKKKGYKQTEEHINNRLESRSYTFPKWIIITPRNEEIVVINLSKYCRENNLIHGASNLTNGWSYKGYKAKRCTS